MVKRKQIRSAGRTKGDQKSAKGQKGNVEGPSKRRESLSNRSQSSDATDELEILPRDHVGSRFCDSRVYVPTVNEFMADTEQGSMLDEVSLLPLEDLTSLMCGNTVYSLIKNTDIGAGLTRACAELQEKHSHLNLSGEFLTPSAIYAYIELMLRSILNKSSWGDVRVFCRSLSQRLVLARRDKQLFDSNFYRFKMFKLGTVSKKQFDEIQEKGRLTPKETKQLLECLLGNILRFFVLYCVHGFRDQVSTKLSHSGEVMYELKYPAPLNTMSTASESEQALKECIPLGDDHIPRLKDLKKRQWDGCSSLRYQVAHLPVLQITRLVLGEELYKTISTTYPAFIVHLEEYATLLKKTQSHAVHERLFAEARKRNISNIIPWNIVSKHIFKVFELISDWWYEAMEKYLRNLLRKRLRELKPRNKEQLLWSSEDCDHGSAKLYYPLKRFGSDSHSLPKNLLQSLCRRFNHFFMVYAVHTLREGVRVTDKDGSIQFCLNRHPFKRLSRLITQRVSQPSPSQDAGTDWSEEPAKEPTCASSSKQSPNRSKISPADNKCSVMSTSAKPVVEEVFRDWRTPSAPKTLPLTAPAEDNDWELKFYERVKQDPDVPIYFKTTFGILVANNRDLRAERTFLHNRLNGL